MNPATAIRYTETEVPLRTDPLTAVTRLAAAGLHENYAVYENNGQWSFGSGALAEVSVDGNGTRLRTAFDTKLFAWDGAPLQWVQQALGSLSIEGWRAYGWATFELTFAKDGDGSTIGDQRVLHLVVPHTEVRLTEGRALLRSADAETLAAAQAVLDADPADSQWQPAPVDVRGHGASDYQQAVRSAVAEISANKLQKVILSRTFPLQQRIDFIGTYVTGRRGNNPARSFLLRLGGIESAGFSPEIVCQVTPDGRVAIQPLAGTRALTPDPARNQSLRDELLSDAKEIYEHAISVKCACDDLREVCTAESLNVEEFMAIRERGTVQHLASRVTGQLAPGQHAWDAFGAAFPAVTASGVPRDAACASIREHEGRGRGLYSGAVLTADQDGSLDAALVLRAIYRQNGMTWLQAGAGIVGQSRPVREFEETCEKLDSVAQFLVPAAQAGAVPRGARPATSAHTVASGRP